MKRWFNILWPIGLVSVGLVVAAAAAWSARGTAQAQTAMMKVVPASQTVDVGDGNFTVDIVIENVSNLGCYEFKLSFDPAVIRLVGVENGPFLGSTERQLHCPAPRFYYPEPGAPADTLRFSCATQNPNPPGPNGSGVLATVTFAPIQAGTSLLILTASDYMTGIADVSGDHIDVGGQNGEVTVVGSGPPATAEPDEPTPIPTEEVPPPPPTATPGGPAWLTPEPGETPMAHPISTGDTTGSGSTGQAGAGGGSVGATGSSPVSGTGPPEKEGAWWPTLAGGLLAVGGATFLSLAFYLQRAGSRRRIQD